MPAHAARLWNDFVIEYMILCVLNGFHTNTYRLRFSVPTFRSLLLCGRCAVGGGVHQHEHEMPSRLCYQNYSRGGAQAITIRFIVYFIHSLICFWDTVWRLLSTLAPNRIPLSSTRSLRTHIRVVLMHIQTNIMGDGVVRKFVYDIWRVPTWCRRRDRERERSLRPFHIVSFGCWQRWQWQWLVFLRLWDFIERMMRKEISLTNYFLKVLT